LIVTVSGMPGSGKSTLARNLAKALGLRHHSTGELWRKLAAEKGLSPLELNKKAESDERIDREIDERTEKLGKRENDFVMDSRMAWHFIPHSIKIFTKIRPEIAAKRIFKDMREGERENKSEKKTLKSLKKRMKSERKRYKQLYGVDYLDEKNYDFVVNTAKTSIEEAAEKALEFVKQRAAKP